MLLPWSTVAEMSAAEFLLTEMLKHSYSQEDVYQIDKTIRQMVTILKEAEYSFALKGNRGSIGAYSKLYLAGLWVVLRRLKKVKARKTGVKNIRLKVDRQLNCKHLINM